MKGTEEFLGGENPLMWKSTGEGADLMIIL